MKQKAGPQNPAAEQVIKDIRRATRKHHSAEDKIRIVLEGLRGEDSIAALCRREGIAERACRSRFAMNSHRKVEVSCFCKVGMSHSPR
jgi:transposase